MKNWKIHLIVDVQKGTKEIITLNTFLSCGFGDFEEFGGVDDALTVVVEVDLVVHLAALVEEVRPEKRLLLCI